MSDMTQETTDQVPNSTLAVLTGILRRLMSESSRHVHQADMPNLRSYIKYGWHLGSMLAHPDHKHLHGEDLEPQELIENLTHILHGFKVGCHVAHLKMITEYTSKMIFRAIADKDEEEQKAILRNAYEAMQDYYKDTSGRRRLDPDSTP